MKNQKSLRRLIVLPIALPLLFCGSGITLSHFYTLFPDPSGEILYPPVYVRWFPNNGSLSLDSESGPLSLAQGNTDIFTPLLSTPETPINDNQILWQQTDYLNIATAAFDHLWGPTVADWDLVGLQFDTSCQDSQIGFSDAKIIYQKLESNTPSRYDARQLDIYPRLSKIDWGEDTGFPHILFESWKNLKPSQLQIDAIGALGMAENKAIQNGHLFKEKECKIWVTFWSDNTYEWMINFEGIAVNCRYNYYRMRVNSQNGEIQQGFCQAN